MNGTSWNPPLLVAFSCFAFATAACSSDRQEAKAPSAQTGIVEHSVSPTSLRLAVGEGVRLLSAARRGDGTVEEGVRPRWSVAEPAVASISEDGWLSALAPGRTTIHADLDGLQAEAWAFVFEEPADALHVEPSALGLRREEEVPLAIRVLDRQGRELSDKKATWHSTDPMIAAVEGGVVRGKAPGRTFIDARVDGLVARVPVEVHRPVARLQIESPAEVLTVGETRRLVLRATDSAGAPLPPAPVRWASSEPAVIRVDADGVVEALAEGYASLEANLDSATARLSLQVVAPVERIEWRGPAALLVGQRAPLSWRLFSADGRAINGKQPRWSVDPDGIVSLDENGAMSALAEGRVEVTADVDRARLRQAVEVKRLRLDGTTVGLAATCGVDASAGDVYCWGTWPVSGSLGRGERLVTKDPAALTRGGGFRQVAVGHATICVLHADGGIACQGTNDNGTLGDGSTLGSDVPIPVASDRSFRALVAGAMHSCALDEESVAWCWGSNLNGRLGIGEAPGTLPFSSHPTPLAGEHRWASLSLAETHGCGLIQDTGEARCWGANTFGQLGDGSTLGSNAPVAVVQAPAEGFVEIGVGSTHSCGRTASGGIWCWGDNRKGQLGTGSSAPSSVPQHVAGAYAFQALRLGETLSCGITEEGRVACWGAHPFGALDEEATPGQSALPVFLRGEERYLDLSIGAFQVCGLTVEDEVRCWTSATPSLHPTPVAGQ